MYSILVPDGTENCGTPATQECAPSNFFIDLLHLLWEESSIIADLRLIQSYKRELIADLRLIQSYKREPNNTRPETWIHFTPLSE